jgi:hypothetical protein
MKYDAPIYKFGLSDEAHRGPQNAESSVDNDRRRIHKGTNTNISMEAIGKHAGSDDHGLGYGRSGIEDCYCNFRP